MIFEFVNDGETIKVEVDNDLVTTSYIEFELCEENDEDKIKIEEESD